ncbi:sensor histidine kinase [Actinokineospora sp. HUAS TT18]|uniref:sensor histidine kinase n=1 Tax=Actinokineospora sp. HUAS TT18 TaxID=3447451 RepID=UPI003F523191
MTESTFAMPIPALLRVGMHLLVLGLLALAAGRAVVDHTAAPAVVAVAALVGAVYAAGPRWAEGRSLAVIGLWLGALMATWLVLLALTPVAIYLAFPWFFLLLHLLPRAIGLTAVVLTTAAAVAGFAWHQTTFTVAMAVGPALGACVVIATVLGYQALHAESEQRRRLIVELERTRAELATVERRAGVLDERERLAREIHDTLAQGLSSIQLLLRAAERHRDPDRAVLVEQARQTAQDNLAEARRFVRALAPADLRESTLPAALGRLCETTAARSGIEVAFHLEGPSILLPTPIEVALLRVAQSALANTTQHSRATRADVTLTVMDTTVTLDVVDDGIGFDPSVGGFGLHSMRSRTAEIGGLLTVESQPGAGAAVTVHLDRR